MDGLPDQRSIAGREAPGAAENRLHNVRSGVENKEKDWCSARAQFFNELRRLLQDDSLKEALWWQPRSGTIVINPAKFEKLVLPKYFRTRKFASFQRRLNRWGFRSHRCLTVLGDTKAYRNRDFRLDEDSAAPSGLQSTASPFTAGPTCGREMGLIPSEEIAMSRFPRSSFQPPFSLQRRQVTEVMESMHRRVSDVAKVQDDRLLMERRWTNDDLLRQLANPTALADKRSPSLIGSNRDKSTRLALLRNQSLKQQPSAEEEAVLELLTARMRENGILESQLRRNNADHTLQQQLAGELHKGLAGELHKGQISEEDRVALLRLEILRLQSGEPNSEQSDNSMLESLLLKRAVGQARLPAASSLLDYSTIAQNSPASAPITAGTSLANRNLELNKMPSSYSLARLYPSSLGGQSKWSHIGREACVDGLGK